MIFGISVKNCIQPCMFRLKNFSDQNWPEGDQGENFLLNIAVGDQRPVLARKNIWAKCIWLDAVFHADSEYHICFALTLFYDKKRP